jgi:hypothetical protein
MACIQAGWQDDVQASHLAYRGLKTGGSTSARSHGQHPRPRREESREEDLEARSLARIQ